MPLRWDYCCDLALACQDLEEVNVSLRKDGTCGELWTTMQAIVGQRLEQFGPEYLDPEDHDVIARIFLREGVVVVEGSSNPKPPFSVDMAYGNDGADGSKTRPFRTKMPPCVLVNHCRLRRWKCLRQPWLAMYVCAAICDRDRARFQKHLGPCRSSLH